MSITRSQIARQLLAEGGAPRRKFFKGGYGDETEDFDFQQEAPASSSPSFTGIDSGGFDPGVAAPQEQVDRFSGGNGDDNFFTRTLKNIGIGVVPNFSKKNKILYNEKIN